jgi:hypothetical protein
MKIPSRTVLEFAGVGLAIIAVLVTWWWGEYERRAQLAAAQTRSDGEFETARMLALETRDRLLKREAEGVLRAFSAGLHPSVVESRVDSVDAAVVGLIQLPEVIFAHVVTAEGVVIASSDRKLVEPENVGERGRWALQATDLQTRPGDADETLELAMPLAASSGWHVVVWVGYDIGAAGAATGEP